MLLMQISHSSKRMARQLQVVAEFVIQCGCFCGQFSWKLTLILVPERYDPSCLGYSQLTPSPCWMTGIDNGVNVQQLTKWGLLRRFARFWTGFWIACHVAVHVT